MSSSTLAQTQLYTKEFLINDGKNLQQKLLEWDNEHLGTSYIADLWYDEYLHHREPLPLNLNPQLTWRQPLAKEKCDQAVRAAELIHAAVRFHLTLRAGALEPDVFHTKDITKNRVLQTIIAGLTPKVYGSYPMYALGAYPLDMSQYSRLFASTRIPHFNRDELYTAPGAREGYSGFGEGPGAHCPTHIIIMRGSRFYKINVVTDKETPVPVETIESQIRCILNDKILPYTVEPPIGALTGAGRDEWAAARAELESHPINATNLRLIDDSLFVVTLEDNKPETHEDISNTMLHGNGRNRWFDKCFNLIITGNGRAGVNWEHAWGDGAAVLYFFNTVHKVISDMPIRPRAPDIGTLPSVGTAGNNTTGIERLNWHLSPSAIAAIHVAEARRDATMMDTELKVFSSSALTKEAIKASKLSPDGLMQMVLQLAHYRAHDQAIPVTYESASTAAYKHGRTETIRSATPLSVEMCKIFGMESKSTLSTEDIEKRIKALQAATNRHRKTSLDAVMGKGVDRHLFALQRWSERLNMKPSIFSDPAYAHFKDIRLSTSTLTSDALDGGGFGPVSRTSYGVGYGVEERGCHFHVMCYSNRPGSRGEIPSKASTTDFAIALESSMKDFYEVIKRTKQNTSE